MTEIEYSLKLDELDRLLNDPEIAMQPAKVWDILEEISAVESSIVSMGLRPQPRQGSALERIL